MNQGWPKALDEIERLNELIDSIRAVVNTSTPNIDSASIRGIIMMINNKLGNERRNTLDTSKSLTHSRPKPKGTVPTKRPDIKK